MRLDVSQQFRLQQQMKLSPRMIQAMEILQLPLMALQERIEEELSSNPVLELKDGIGETPPEPAEGPAQPSRGDESMVVGAGASSPADFERLDNFGEAYGEDFEWSDRAPRRAASAGERDVKLDALANTPAPDETLAEYLLGQWLFVEAPEDVKAAGRVIITNIDDDGYLRTPLEELAGAAPPVPPEQFEIPQRDLGSTGVSPVAEYAPTGGTPVLPSSLESLQTALPLVQKLDPPGVGARDLRECLLIQLDAEAGAGADVSLSRLLAAEFLREIELNHIPQIARKTGKSVEQIKDAVAWLGRLDPRPGRTIGQRSVPFVVPDAAVEPDDGGALVVTMRDGDVPALRISHMYLKMARTRTTDKQVRDFLRQNVRSAQWLIGAIMQRRHTVKRVIEEVFSAQKDFLDKGPEALHPLPMTDVAARVGVHVATVSRAVAGKYVQTPRGIFPLRMFFSGGTTTTGGEEMAWDAIRVRTREVVDGEDKTRPLNDDQIAEALSGKGIVIARRTVAKYRNLLNIPPARQRRRY